MDSAYGSDDLRAAAEDRNLIPVVPAHPRLKNPWQLDKQRYRQRNEVERLFRRIKAYRRVFTRYDKLDAMFAAFVSLALILGKLCKTHESRRGSCPAATQAVLTQFSR